MLHAMEWEIFNILVSFYENSLNIFFHVCLVYLWFVVDSLFGYFCCYFHLFYLKVISIFYVIIFFLFLFLVSKLALCGKFWYTYWSSLLAVREIIVLYFFNVDFYMSGKGALWDLLKPFLFNKPQSL